MMEILALLLDAAKGIAWPVAAYLIAKQYSAEIKKLLPRIQKVGPNGVDLFPEGQKGITSSNDDQARGELKNLRGQERTNAIRALEKHLHESIAAVEQGERIDVALRDLAQSRLDTHFALVYNSIFGSQILLLKRLREVVSVSMDHVEEYFKEQQDRFDEFEKWDVERYLSFLVERNLLVIEQSNIKISDIGEDFVLFLHRARLSDNKLL